MENSKIFKEKNFISLVVYLRNCENNVVDFLINIDKIFSYRFTSFEFVLVNDDCTDKTIDLVKSISDKLNGNVNLINLAYEHGVEMAMLSGVEFSIGDFIFEFDNVNIDYDINLVMELYDKALSGFDVVAASPYNSIPFSSKLFYKYLSHISRKNMNLKTETFRIVSRRALNRILRSKEKLRYRKALYHYSGFNTSVIDYNVTKNIKRNDITLSNKISLASDILVSFSDIGTKLSSLICIIFFLISIFTIVYTIISYITVKNIQAGWTTTMIFISICFTGLFFVLSIISKYLSILLYEIQDHPRYLYKSIERLSKK